MQVATSFLSPRLKDVPLCVVPKSGGDAFSPPLPMRRYSGMGASSGKISISNVLVPDVELETVQ